MIYTLYVNRNRGKEVVSTSHDLEIIEAQIEVLEGFELTLSVEIEGINYELVTSNKQGKFATYVVLLEKAVREKRFSNEIDVNELIEESETLYRSMMDVWANVNK